MGARPYMDGFRLDGPIETGDAVLLPIAAVNISRGDILIDNAAGYLTNAAITAFSDVAHYVAIDNGTNSAGAAGDVSILCVPISIAKNRFWVPNNSATVAAQTDVGEVIDLDSEDDVDVTDTTCIAWGFLVEEIDISAAAIAVKTGGYIKGRFLRLTA